MQNRGIPWFVFPLLYLFSFWIIFENSFAVVSFVVRRHTPAELNAALSLYNNSFLKKNINPIQNDYSRLRPYHAEYTGSRLNTEVTQRRARLVLGWETSWEYRVL